MREFARNGSVGTRSPGSRPWRWSQFGHRTNLNRSCPS